MKKLISYLVFTVCIVTATTSQTLEEKDREMFKKHNVKTRIKLDYNFKGDLPSLEGKLAAKSFYDKNGRILKSFAFNQKGDTVNYDKYKYDQRGNRIFYERKSLHGKYKKESEYNQINNIVEEEGFDGNATFQTIFKYDDKNRVVEIIYLVNEDVDEKRVYTYSSNQASVKILKLGKHLISKVKLTFNAKNKIIKEEQYNLEGELTENKNIKYNTRGDILIEEKFKFGKLYYRMSYAYDSKGDLLSISEETLSKKKYVKKKFAYDTQGRIIEYQWKRRPDDEYNIKKFKYTKVGVCNEEHTYYPRTNYKLLTKYEYNFY